ncbi:hypothetical protein [Mycolicibacterium conceptionense]|nr:hypothetical protein [Mycolicibacterium conceptionense]
MPVRATVNSPIDGVQVSFTAENDDELWAKFHAVFDGQWESGYADIDSFLEDNGLQLD